MGRCGALPREGDEPAESLCVRVRGQTKVKYDVMDICYKLSDNKE